MDRKQADEAFPVEIYKNSGATVAATPKPRAGEHTWHDDKMLILALRDEVDALAARLETCKAAHMSNCLDADKLRAQNRELVEALASIDQLMMAMPLTSKIEHQVHGIAHRTLRKVQQ